MLKEAFYVLIVVLLAIGASFASKHNAKMGGNNNNMGMNMGGMESMEERGSMDMTQMGSMRQEMVDMMQRHIKMMEAGELSPMSPKMVAEMMSLMNRDMALMREHMGDNMMDGNMMGGNMGSGMHMQNMRMDMMHMRNREQEMVSMMQRYGEMMEAGELPPMSAEMMAEMTSLMGRNMALMREHMGSNMMDGNMMGGNMGNSANIDEDTSMDTDDNGQ